MIIEIRLKSGKIIELKTSDDPVSSDWLKALMTRISLCAED